MGRTCARLSEDPPNPEVQPHRPQSKCACHSCQAQRTRSLRQLRGCFVPGMKSTSIGATVAILWAGTRPAGLGMVAVTLVNQLKKLGWAEGCRRALRGELRNRPRLQVTGSEGVIWRCAVLTL